MFNNVVGRCVFCLLLALLILHQRDGNAAPLPKTFPGNAWNSFGNPSPAEKGNIINSGYIEQGYTLLRYNTVSLVPYASGMIVSDTDNHDWNNKTLIQGGVKFVRMFPRGIISVGAAVADEYRFLSEKNKTELIGFGSWWFGWNLPIKTATRFSEFPGNTWGIFGNVSPIEKGNFIGLFRIEQGMLLARIRKASLIPFLEITSGFDSDGFAWNNRLLSGAGIKCVLPVASGIVEAGGVYRNEWRWKTGMREDGVSLFLNVWFGWNLLA